MTFIDDYLNLLDPSDPLIQNLPDKHQQNYNIMYFRWLILTKLPIICKSLTIFRTSRIFGINFFKEFDTSILFSEFAGNSKFSNEKLSEYEMIIQAVKMSNLMPKIACVSEDTRISKLINLSKNLGESNAIIHEIHNQINGMDRVLFDENRISQIFKGEKDGAGSGLVDENSQNHHLTVNNLMVNANSRDQPARNEEQRGLIQFRVIQNKLDLRVF